MNIVLIVGSAPDALRIKSFDLSAFTSCVAINNAWRLKKDWDYVISVSYTHLTLPTNREV